MVQEQKHHQGGNDMQEKKTSIAFIQAHTISELISIVNTYNANNPQCPILKEDIVKIMNEEGTHILLYYK